MDKELEVYKAIATLEMSAMSDDKMTVEKAEELRQIIEQELEVLKIIKEKKVQVAIFLLSNSCIGYNMARGLLGEDLTEEEYNLLREVLL